MLASYPIPANSIYVGFVAIFLGLLACFGGSGALALYAVKRHQVRVEHLVNATVDRVLRKQGLQLVDRD